MRDSHRDPVFVLSRANHDNKENGPGLALMQLGSWLEGHFAPLNILKRRLSVV